MSDHHCHMSFNGLSGQGNSMYFLSTVPMKNSTSVLGFHVEEGVVPDGEHLLNVPYNNKMFYVIPNIETQVQSSAREYNDDKQLLEILLRALDQKISEIAPDRDMEMVVIGSGQHKGLVPISKNINNTSNMVYAVDPSTPYADQIQLIPAPTESEILTGQKTDVSNLYPLLLHAFLQDIKTASLSATPSV